MLDSKSAEIKKILQLIKSEAERGCWNYIRVVHQDDVEGNYDLVAYNNAPELREALRKQGVSENLIKDLDEKAKIVSSQINWHFLVIAGMLVSVGLATASPFIIEPRVHLADDIIYLGIIFAVFIGGFILLGGAGYLAGNALNSTQQCTQEKNDFEQCCQNIINEPNGIGPETERISPIPPV